MPRNVEIKARVPDPERLRRVVADLADGPPEHLRQEDTFFACEEGRLKLRRFSDGSGELIFYQRPDATGPAESRFSKTPVDVPITMLTVLGDALGITGVVRKQREVYLVGRTRIHLDEVEDVGSFLELEVVLEDHQKAADGEAVARSLMDQLGVTDEDLIDVAYVDLLERMSGNQDEP